MQKILFIASHQVWLGHTVLQFDPPPPPKKSVKILMLTDLIIETAIREREEIQSGDEQEQ